MPSPGPGATARSLEAAGYDGAWSAETSHDPFLPHVLAADATDRLELGTGIAVAFARSPMTLANTAWDLQVQSEGRFLLGLGSQIKPHITKRFSMPWSQPAARMREMILAIRAIWDCWDGDGKLDFRGDFYTHTLMTPFFNPGPSPHGHPKVFLAAVGRADDRGGRRGGRRHPVPRLHHGVLPPGADAAGSGDGSGEGRSVPLRPRAVHPRVHRDRQRRGGDGRRRPPACAARSPSTARPPRTAACWSTTAGATCRTSSTGCPSRASGPRWASSSTTRSSTPSPWWPSPTPSPVPCSSGWGGLVDRISFYAPYETDRDTWLPVVTALKAG